MSARLELAPLARPRELSRPEGTEIRPEGEWLVIVDPAPATEVPLGTPGLWRVVPGGATPARVHEVPLVRGVDGEDGPPTTEALAQLLAWAAATRRGEVPAGWTPPPRDELEGWIAPGRLRARSGALVVRGELACEPGRLALVFPELVALPATLAPARRAWLDALLVDAHRRWRLVRFGLDGGAVRAEVDLTGVPAPWARPLVQLSLEALAWAVEWALAPLAFLADLGASSEALERHEPPALQGDPR